jgi:hypothetical protein
MHIFGIYQKMCKNEPVSRCIPFDATLGLENLPKNVQK